MHDIKWFSLFCLHRIGSGKQVASVIVDDGKDDDDDETFVVEDNTPITNDIDSVSFSKNVNVILLYCFLCYYFFTKWSRIVLIT